jgi:sterol 3beta-glucosyltransferase
MKIVLVTAGSRGDVQPYVALGRGLQRNGHKVTMVTDPSFADLARSGGLDFAGTQIITQEVMQTELKAMGGSPWKLTRWMERNFKPLAKGFFQDVYDISAGADAILYSTLAFVGFHVAQARKIPPLAVYTVPITPTRYFPNPSAAIPPAWLPLAGLYNYGSMWAANLGFIALIYSTVNEGRLRLGLHAAPWQAYARLATAPIPILYGYSSLVLPKPPDWGDWLHVCGYWTMEAPNTWEPPGDLTAFLEAGSAPVYVGFGSMVDQEAARATEIVIQALQLAGQRGILLGGWAGLGRAGLRGGSLPETIFQIDTVPHSWLFPRVSAVVHHGGAGTTAAGLRAGKPSLVVPYFADQPFWGWRVAQLGAGPKPIMRKRLNARYLAAGIRQIVGDEGMRQRALELGEKLRMEDGVGNGVRLIERTLGRWPKGFYDPFG